MSKWGEMRRQIAIRYFSQQFPREVRRRQNSSFVSTVHHIATSICYGVISLVEEGLEYIPVLEYIYPHPALILLPGYYLSYRDPVIQEIKR